MTRDSLRQLKVGDSVRWTCDPPIGGEVKHISTDAMLVVWDDGESTAVPFDTAETRGLADCIEKATP